MNNNERVISDPEVAGWELDPDTGYWMWKGEEGTGGLWTDNGDTSISYMDGNVGIGVLPTEALEVDGPVIAGGGLTQGHRTNAGVFQYGANLTRIRSYGDVAGSGTFAVEVGGGGGETTTPAMTIDADGNVGIGTEPSSQLHISKRDLTEYDGSSTDGQLSSGATFLIEQTAGSNNAQAQLVFQPRTGFGYNRIVSSGGSAPFMAFCTNNSEAMRIDADGDVILAHPAGLYGRRTSGDLALKLIGYVPGTDNVELVASNEWLLKNGSGNTLIKASSSGRVDIPGTLYVNGTPKIGHSELITTLVTLRKATMDDTQDIRESLRDAIDELVEGFEQEIATMPALEE